MHCRTWDIGGAYSEPKVRRKVYMWLNPQLTSIFISMYPDYKPLVMSDGKLLLLLKSGKLWNDNILATLLAAGFTKSLK